MTNLLVFLKLFVLFLGGSDRLESGCLEREWALLPNQPEGTAKRFDIANDYDANGDRYSCSAFVTPSEIQELVDQIRSVAEVNDVPGLSDLVRYPIAVYSDAVISSASEPVRFDAVVLHDKQEFEAHFRAGIPPDIRTMMMCISLSNMEIDKNAGVSGAFGSIWITRTAESRKLLIHSLSLHPVPLANWLASNCEPG